MEDNNCCESEQNPQCSSYSEIYGLIGRISKNLDKFQTKNLEKIPQNDEKKITPSQYIILKHLWNTDKETKVSDLTDVCYCSKSTVSGILNTMQKNGLITREHKPGQRRISFVKLTKKGVKLEKKAAFVDPAMNNCCSGFKDEELSTLKNLLLKLNNTLIP